MQQLSPQQQKDLKTYRTTGELGSLSNILIENCLEKLKKQYQKHLDSLQNNTPKVRFFYNEFGLYEYTHFTPCLQSASLFIAWQSPIAKQVIIQALLSRTPDGQAVMPFLDVPLKYNQYIINPSNNCSLIEKERLLTVTGNFTIESITTLQEKLSLEFWRETSMKGKTPDQALEIITKIYVDNTYL